MKKGLLVTDSSAHRGEERKRSSSLSVENRSGMTIRGEESDWNQSAGTTGVKGIITQSRDKNKSPRRPNNNPQLSNIHLDNRTTTSSSSSLLQQPAKPNNPGGHFLQQKDTFSTSTRPKGIVHQDKVKLPSQNNDNDERVVNLSKEDMRMEKVLEKAIIAEVHMGQSEILTGQNDDDYVLPEDCESAEVTATVDDCSLEKVVEVEGCGEMQEDGDSEDSTAVPPGEKLLLESSSSSLSVKKKQKKRKLKKGKVKSTGGDSASSNSNRVKRNKLLLEEGESKKIKDLLQLLHPPPQQPKNSVPVRNVLSFLPLFYHPARTV
jgi:hypothetical protein